MVRPSHTVVRAKLRSPIRVGDFVTQYNKITSFVILAYCQAVIVVVEWYDFLIPTVSTTVGRDVPTTFINVKAFNFAIEGFVAWQSIAATEVEYCLEAQPSVDVAKEVDVVDDFHRKHSRAANLPNCLI